MTTIVHCLSFVLFLPLHVIKTPCNPIAHPVRPPQPNIANTIPADPQSSSSSENIPVKEISTTRMEQSDKITTPPTVYASASLTPPNEIDINNQAWKEAWRFANQITYSPRLQSARGDLEEGTYRANLDKDVVELRELEGRLWERNGAGSERDGDGDGEGDDGWEVDCKPGRKRALSEGTARGGRRGFVYLAFAGMVCYSFGGLSGVFYWLVIGIVN